MAEETKQDGWTHFLKDAVGKFITAKAITALSLLIATYASGLWDWLTGYVKTNPAQSIMGALFVYSGLATWQWLAYQRTAKTEREQSIKSTDRASALEAKCEALSSEIATFRQQAMVDNVTAKRGLSGPEISVFGFVYKRGRGRYSTIAEVSAAVAFNQSLARQACLDLAYVFHYFDIFEGPSPADATFTIGENGLKHAIQRGLAPVQPYQGPSPTEQEIERLSKENEAFRRYLEVHLNGGTPASSPLDFFSISDQVKNIIEGLPPR